MYVGIDVAAAHVHCVAISSDGLIEFARLVSSDDLRSLARQLSDMCGVAIDAPSALSTGPHVKNHGPTLGAKFWPARCAEICLGQEYGVWVPWIAPRERPPNGWLATGFDLFTACRSAGFQPIEVYPHAAFRTIHGAGLPSKRSADGIKARVNVLERMGIARDSLEMWSHDGLDTLVAAVVARDHAHNRATQVTCGHDDLAIWLPAARSAA
jgi:predicted nuclease with RNAse H fold